MKKRNRETDRFNLESILWDFSTEYNVTDEVDTLMTMIGNIHADYEQVVEDIESENQRLSTQNWYLKLKVARLEKTLASVELELIDLELRSLK